MYIPLNFPEIESGDWSIQSFTDNGISYQKLVRNGVIRMVNTPDIVKDFEAFLKIAEGTILINGLGMGMCNVHLLAKDTVTDLTVIEYDKSLVDFISPLFADDPRCTIIHADAFTFEPPEGKFFDYVWHDVWTMQSYTNVAQIQTLKEKYKNIAGWQGAWRETLVQQQLEKHLARVAERGY